MKSCLTQFERAAAASRSLNGIEQSKINAVLLKLADKTEAEADVILAANAKDLEKMPPDNPLYDRLLLTEERISGIAADIRKVAALPSPIGEILSEWTRPNGMKIQKIRVPFGVIGIIYEARPNVSFDVFSLCFKSGNAVVLKGGSDAHFSNETIVGLIRQTLEEEGLNPDIATLLPPDRESAATLLNARGYVDLLIPRGSASLINFVRENAKIPVIETGAGICHTYFDLSGNADMGAGIIFNAKTRRVSVCNALDCLIVHSGRLNDLPALCRRLSEKNVVIFADEPAYLSLNGNYPKELLKHSDKDSYGTEFLDYKMAVKTVDSLDEALSHIARYSSKHSETIVTEDDTAAGRFLAEVDAACVYHNVSTAFTDGAQFGFGAEIGISTQKLHARGPMALPELTTYKYVIRGDGQTRPY
ncbi:MAG: glutamate-5-semialdehyde dehydrogenase [Dysgonamonadaceae bacterium]|jgi:glutamate-5-semialdehyde dehydrogenase|nr:glutamate-5-semialdehyde dehydrogenase [Dysgonamonadaceae bacterium]